MSKQRAHFDCPPGCYWCALRKARAAREVEGVHRQVDAETMLRDLDQICNFIGDDLAGILDDKLRHKVLSMTLQWLADRVGASVRRNLRNPAYAEAHRSINGETG